MALELTAQEPAESVGACCMAESGVFTTVRQLSFTLCGSLGRRIASLYRLKPVSFMIARPVNVVYNRGHHQWGGMNVGQKLVFREVARHPVDAMDIRDPELSLC